MKLRVGTRGSDLALWQTNWVSDRLREKHPELELEQIIIKTHGDVVTDKNFGRDWPVGAFVSALENALLAEEVDIAVHSFKDLQTAETAGLTIAATPPREVVHDVLFTNGATRLEDLPAGAKIGTNSPRRAAQFQQYMQCEIVPIRGNVPTRIKKLETEGLDAVALAGAGVKRLGITHPHVIELDPDQIVPAPAQGALAVQTRSDGPAADVVRVLEDAVTRTRISAEREFLRTINAGCHTPVGALATITRAGVALHAKLFSDDFTRHVEGKHSGADPAVVGRDLAEDLLRKLQA